MKCNFYRNRMMYILQLQEKKSSKEVILAAR